MIMDTEKSQDLPSASWRPRKQWYNSVWVEGLRTRSSDIWGQKKMDVPPQIESKFALPLPFCSIHALNRLDDAPLPSIGEGDLLYPVYWVKC